MQVVAARPQYVSREEVPTDILAKEREIYREQLVDSNKPPQVVEQIIEGKVNKWYSENCLLEQDFIKDPSVTIQSLLTDQIAALGENIRVNRFARLEIGG
ncbi:MAG: elongation factor Ts, partial [Caldilineaceae bacterium]|nr:elongation factor Ts [Caldilineaceae bacterium]